MQQQLQQHRQAAAAVAVHTNCVEGVFLLDGFLAFCHFFDDGCECFPFLFAISQDCRLPWKQQQKINSALLRRQHNFVMIDFFCCFSIFDGRRRFFAHKLFSLGQFNNFFVSVLWFSFVCHAKLSKPNENSVVGDWFCPLRVLISIFCAENKEITRFFRKNLSENKQQIILFNERMTAQSKLHEWMTVQSRLSKN